MQQDPTDRFGPDSPSGIGPCSARYQDERLAEGRMTLGALSAALSALDQTLPVRTRDGLGLHRPHSYRGYYVDLAFEQDKKTDMFAGCDAQRVGDLLALVRSSVGAEFVPWKGGGAIRMSENTPVWIAPMGDIGEYLSGVVVEHGVVILESEEEAW